MCRMGCIRHHSFAFLLLSSHMSPALETREFWRRSLLGEESSISSSFGGRSATQRRTFAPSPMRTRVAGVPRGLSLRISVIAPSFARGEAAASLVLTRLCGGRPLRRATHSDRPHDASQHSGRGPGRACTFVGEPHVRIPGIASAAVSNIRLHFRIAVVRPAQHDRPESPRWDSAGLCV